MDVITLASVTSPFDCRGMWAGPVTASSLRSMYAGQERTAPGKGGIRRFADMFGRCVLAPAALAAQAAAVRRLNREARVDRMLTEDLTDQDLLDLQRGQW
jgi:hypothetical protein